jgi:dimethylglycine dehydrogenase
MEACPLLFDGSFMKSHARVVVVGGGVVGVSVLYHLTKAGWPDVVLVEKSELTSGSTWHAAGGVTTMNSDANVSRLQKYTFDLYAELEKITGQSVGMHHNGGLMLAVTDGQHDLLRLTHSRARALGMETAFISMADALEMNPFIETRHFQSCLWRADGGHVDPAGTTQAYAQAARLGGAEIYRFTRVVETNPRADGGWEVVTDKGTIIAEHIVNAAGLWARDFGRKVGLELPIQAMEHHYIITEAMEALKGRAKEIVNTNDFDGEIYFRQERESILMGTYEQACTPWSYGKTPEDFSMQLLPETLDKIAPELERGFEHFPALASIGIKKAVNGPFTFSPDGNPLVGPVPGLKNYWVAAAVMAGFSQGGGVGLVLSRWMVDGDPGMDTLGMDVARFGAFATPRYTLAKVQENYRRRFRFAYPNEELPAARPLRQTPIYQRLQDRGAVFGANFGIESPVWFAPKGVEPVETPTYRRSNAFEHVRNECRFVRETVGLYESSNFGKYEITGAGARGFLDRVFACRIPKPGRMTLAPMLNKAGRIIGDLSISCLADDRYLIIGSGFAEQFHLRWFASQSPPPDCFIRPAASLYAGFSLTGPNARKVLEKIADFDCSNEAFKFFAVKEAALGMAPAIIGRCSFTGELGYEIWVAPDYQCHVFDAIMEAGQEFGLGLFGGRAISALRLEKSYGSFNKDFRPDYTSGETGLSAFIDWQKPHFTGMEAALKERDTGPKKKFVTLLVEDGDCDVIGYEAILKDGKAVGYVTSGGYGFTVGKSIALGYVPTHLAEEGAAFAIDILGIERKAMLVTKAPYDPEGLRLKL